MSNSPIQTLVADLTTEFRRDPRGQGVAERLRRYLAANDDWRRFRHFRPDGYARNLVARNDLFELIVICWQAGQESPIHNHAGSDCWMGILEGNIEEVLYDSVAEGAPQPTASRTYPRGGVGFINDDIALHLIRPTGDERGVSLHLYAKPIGACNVYDPVTGRVERRELGYYTRDGIPVG